MTLLLGPPSSGKTTLLLALAGKLDPALKVLINIVASSHNEDLASDVSYLTHDVEFVWQFTGNVTYNGHAMNEFIPQRTAAYISQHDLHIGEMTVRETLAFSARCQGVGTQHG